MPDEFVAGDAFFTAGRPRRLCSDCGRPVQWGTLPDAAHIFEHDPQALRDFAAVIPVGASVYWCDHCPIAGWFSLPFVA